ncbi:MAG TPA: transposase [Gaiellaceae bacterium]|jgi:putative transposase|nr:transposase [Gaiellaceae bacterium]
MPRKPRVQAEGATYHAFTRATGGERLFRDGGDRDRLVAMLRMTARRYEWRVHFVAILGTHCHLLLTTPKPNIAAGMQYLLGVYCRSFNRKYGRFGHLVAGRYGAPLLKSNAHAATLVPYLALNPVKAGLVERPEDWPWSTYASLVGLAPKWDFVDEAWLLEQFDPDPALARAHVRAYVEEELRRWRRERRSIAA